MVYTTLVANNQSLFVFLTPSDMRHHFVVMIQSLANIHSIPEDHYMYLHIRENPGSYGPISENRIFGLTAVVMKSSSFWDITPCTPPKVKRSFGRTCHFQLQKPT
jgi:hypothetical protein